METSRIYIMSMKRLIVFAPLFLISCGSEQVDPKEFLYKFENTRFKTTKFRSFTSQSFILPSGIKSFEFTEEELFIGHQSYSENGVNLCWGDVAYTIEGYDYDKFVELLNEDELLEEEESEGPNSGYDVFDPYKDDPIQADTGSEDEKVEVVRYYFKGQISEKELNSACNLQYEQQIYFQVNFYRDGDMEFLDHNRKLFFFNRPY